MTNPGDCSYRKHLIHGVSTEANLIVKHASCVANHPNIATYLFLHDIEIWVSFLRTLFSQLPYYSFSVNSSYTNDILKVDVTAAICTNRVYILVFGKW